MPDSAPSKEEKLARIKTIANEAFLHQLRTTFMEKKSQSFLAMKMDAMKSFSEFVKSCMPEKIEDYRKIQTSE